MAAAPPPPPLARYAFIIIFLVELGINETDASEDGQRLAAAQPAGPAAAQIPRPSAKYRVYREYFEQRFLDDTRTYYTTESNQFLQTHSHNVPEYMKKVEERLSEERDRCQIYLDNSTLEQLMKTCDEALITAHLELFHDKFEALLSLQQNEHLGRMVNKCA